MTIRLKRVYQPAEIDDGIRILVDRVWPRGLSREQVGANIHLKDIAPSTSLRQWFHHDRARWEEFKQRYFSELDQKRDLAEHILDLGADTTVTLVFAARDEDCNQAVALKEYLESFEKRAPGE